VIVAGSERHWLLVTQNDHAALAAELLASWRSLAALAGRELLLRATRRHDNGWREPDSAPRVDARGRPQDFLAVPAGKRRRLWERGMDRYRRSDPACALLVVEHAIWLHRGTDHDPELCALRAAAEAMKLDLLAEVPAGDVVLAELYPWLRLADDLSLRACWGRTGPFAVEAARAGESLRGNLLREGSELSQEIENPGAPADQVHIVDETGEAPDPRRLLLEPFPFAGATTFVIRCRRIPRRRYLTDAELATQLAGARWLDLPLRVEPMGSWDPEVARNRGRAGRAC
jgi:hypothetical protein